jgi:hypothetical protein
MGHKSLDSHHLHITLVYLRVYLNLSWQNQHAYRQKKAQESSDSNLNIFPYYCRFENCNDTLSVVENRTPNQML